MEFKLTKEYHELIKYLSEITQDQTIAFYLVKQRKLRTITLLQGKVMHKRQNKYTQQNKRDIIIIEELGHIHQIFHHQELITTEMIIKDQLHRLRLALEQCTEVDLVVLQLPISQIL